MTIGKGALSVVLAVGLLGVSGCGGPANEGSGQSPEPEMSSSGTAMADSPSSSGTRMTTSPSAESGMESGTSEEVVITVEDFKFEGPASVSPGATVTVINKDSAPHTVTSEEEGLFDVQFEGGETVTFTAPEKPGEYPYLCTIHPAMKGTLVVE